MHRVLVTPSVRLGCWKMVRLLGENLAIIFGIVQFCLSD